MRTTVVSVFLVLLSKTALSLSISIHHDNRHLFATITRLTLADTRNLLSEACKCTVTYNNSKADVQIRLPAVTHDAGNTLTDFELGKPYPVLHYPDGGYSWSSRDSAGIIILTMNAKTYNGVSFGLYGLLQEKLGFQFYHPRETLIPHFDKWPLTASFHWSARPRFHKMGFHLHTQHPLELTEDLMAPYTEESRNRIKEYIDWLARNQQNYFEYNLLESIDLKQWVENIKPLVDYGKQRGIIMGLDISLHMIQQKAFMLYESFPNSWRGQKRQIDRNLEKLCAAGWDVFDVEFSTTEFTKGNEKKKKQLQLHLTDRLVNKYGVKPMGRMHVVKKDEMLDSGNNKQYHLSPEDSLLDKNRGILIHTVMFYSLADDSAPVYQNENLKHMLEALLVEQQQRETWYYPESAYWITFDNSVPMLLLSYLPARLDDILLCDSLGVTGHITFSSGWEWGYWLFDWSIARWSWTHEDNGVAQQPSPAQFVSTLFKSTEVTRWFTEALRLQQHYIKGRELIRYLTAQTVTDEMPGPFNLQLHPRPDVSYKWMMQEADSVFFRKEIMRQVFLPLSEFANKTDSLNLISYNKSSLLAKTDSARFELLNELYDGIEITRLRARHRWYFLAALFTEKSNEADRADYLTKMEETRDTAQQIVTRREAAYRYPVSLLAGKRYSHTSYQHGYLYSVHELHFWQREEMQLKKDRWGPFYRSMWNIPKIVGVMN